MRRLQGHGVSAGVAAGEALVLDQRTLDVRYRIPETEVAAELSRLAVAAERSAGQLRGLRRKMAQAGSEHGALFDAQLLMLNDLMLLGRARELVRSKLVDASSAVLQAAEELARRFADIDDPYLRERSGDVIDVVGRLRANLRDARAPFEVALPKRDGPFVLVAEALSASAAAQLEWARIAAFALATGSWTHHTAILARALGIPAAVAIRDVTRLIDPGQRVVVDGGSGDVVVDPPDEFLRTMSAGRRTRHIARGPVAPHRVYTVDGREVLLEANVDRAEDVDAARRCGASGIGLVRSEYLLGGRPVASVSEEAQLVAYRSVVSRMQGAPVTIRTFDLRGGALAPGEEIPDWGRVGRRYVTGPSGLRRGVLRRQLRALQRAAGAGPLRVMLPLVTMREQLREARTMLGEVSRELRQAGETPPDVDLGAMIEVPAAAATADLLASEADFFSIGTNDLAQYCLAADRADPEVSQLAAPLHPAVLRMIRNVARLGRRRGVPVSVCGEMAADPATLALLIGLGIRAISMRPSAIPEARRAVERLRFRDARTIAQRALRGAATTEVLDALTAACGGDQPGAGSAIRREA